MVYLTKHEGKLTGLQSISTSEMMNPFCRRMNASANSQCVCTHCYGFALEKCRPSLRTKLAKNYAVLSTRRFAEIEEPETELVRISSFGEIINWRHAESVMNYVMRHPATTFAWWTKRADILSAVMPVEKPANCTFVYSSPTISVESDPRDRYPELFDHVFTVYSKKYIKQNKVDINCGAKSCNACRLCYRHDTPFFVREVLK